MIGKQKVDYVCEKRVENKGKRDAWRVNIFFVFLGGGGVLFLEIDQGGNIAFR
jgi:hypothetical protein